jgi:hypothetical protein
MRSQRRLRLRQAGRHHRDDRAPWPDWPGRLGVARNLIAAFERNCYPKHYGEPIPDNNTTMNYITGVVTWHGRIILQPRESVCMVGHYPLGPHE